MATSSEQILTRHKNHPLTKLKQAIKNSAGFSEALIVLQNQYP
jgi:hypothetical protein